MPQCRLLQRSNVTLFLRRRLPQERLQGNGELLKLRDAFQKLQEVHFFWTRYEGL